MSIAARTHRGEEGVTVHHTTVVDHYEGWTNCCGEGFRVGAVVRVEEHMGRPLDLTLVQGGCSVWWRTRRGSVARDKRAQDRCHQEQSPVQVRNHHGSTTSPFRNVYSSTLPVLPFRVRRTCRKMGSIPQLSLSEAPSCI
jgi:hypothetical protein